MLKKILVFIVLLLLVLAIGARVMIGVWPLNPADWGRTATGIGAKIACSHHFISGFDEPRIRRDLESYFGVLSWLDLEFNHEAQSVTAEMLGFSEQTAEFRAGVGCTLTQGNTALLDQLSAAALPRNDLSNGAPKQNEPAWPLGESVNTIQPKAQSAIEALLHADTLEGQETRALLLVHDGRIVAEAYAEGIDHTTALLGWSMAKSVMAVLIGQLEMQGAIQPEQRQLFPQWSGGPREEITVQQLLTMTSGLAFGEVYLPGTDATKMLFGSGRAAEYAWQQALQYTPSTHFSYSSGTSNLLADLYVRTVGSPTNAYQKLATDLLSPLAMRHTVFEPDASGTFVGSSYVYASARDWARLGQMLLNKGRLNGHRVLPAEWVEQAITPNDSSNYPAYGYQLWLNTGSPALWPDLPGDSYAMKGNRAQRVMVVPSLNAVVVRLGWSAEEYPGSEKFSALLNVIESLE